MAIQAGETTFYQANRGIVQNGLVLNLDAGVEESYSDTGTNWKDLSVGNDANLSNGSSFDNNLGGQLTLDGSDDLVSIPSITFASSGFTYSFVTKLATSMGTDYPRIIAGDKEMEWIRLNQDHLLRFRWNSSSPTSVDSNDDYFIPDEIHMYTITYDGSQAVIYRDGSAFQTLSCTSSSSCSFNTLFNRSSADRPLGGDIFQVLLYNRVLNAAEIRQNYEASVGRYA